MKDKEFNAKLIAYLLGKEELFDEVVTGLPIDYILDI